MNFWTWFWIWLALAIVAMACLGFILKSLLNKLESVAHQIERLAKKTQTLVDAAETKVEVQSPSDSLSEPYGKTLAKLLSLRKAKVKKRERRQRRLISSLKRYPNESRFR